MSLRRLSLHAANAWSCPLLASIDQGEQRKREANADAFFTAMVNLTADLVFVSPLILLCRHVILPAVAARMLHRPLARRVALLNEGSAALKERRTVRGHHHPEDSSAGPYSGGTVADHSNPALAAISVLRAKKVFLKALTHSTRDRAAGGGTACDYDGPESGAVNNPIDPAGSDSGDADGEMADDLSELGPWCEMEDPVLGCNYYYNQETGEASWVPPTSDGSAVVEDGRFDDTGRDRGLTSHGEDEDDDAAMDFDDLFPAAVAAPQSANPMHTLAANNAATSSGGRAIEIVAQDAPATSRGAYPRLSPGSTWLCHDGRETQLELVELRAIQECPIASDAASLVASGATLSFIVEGERVNAVVVSLSEATRQEGQLLMLSSLRFVNWDATDETAKLCVACAAGSVSRATLSIEGANDIPFTVSSAPFLQRGSAVVRYSASGETAVAEFQIPSNRNCGSLTIDRRMVPFSLLSMADGENDGTRAQ